MFNMCFHWLSVSRVFAVFLLHYAFDRTFLLSLFSTRGSTRTHTLNENPGGKGVPPQEANAT